MLALGLAITCMVAGAWLLWVDKRRRSAMLWLLLFTAPTIGFFQVVKSAPFEQLAIAWPAFPSETVRPEQKLPANASQNLTNERQYWKGIKEDPTSLFFGHAERPGREVAPSAHNYYLDLVYNFGIVALLPWLFLFFHSAKLAWTAIRRRTATTDLLWLLAAVAFFALVDNSLKVGFRQPFPGILMFFLWGVLLARLSTVVAPRA
jgi:hypothetical protein